MSSQKKKTQRELPKLIPKYVKVLDTLRRAKLEYLKEPETT